MNDRLRKVVEHPLHRFLGVTDIASEGGRGEMVLTITKNVVNPAGIFHGGVIYLLCDVCAYGGLISLMEADMDAVTHDIQVSVMRSLKLGDVVEFKSEVVKFGTRLCFIDVKVTSSGQPVASARITKSILTGR
ncbi:MAG: PaaI family thioesterase [Thermodesulfobacteriota bacterium]